MPRAYKGRKNSKVEIKSWRSQKCFRATANAGFKKCYGVKRRHQMTCKTTKMKRHARAC